MRPRVGHADQDVGRRHRRPAQFVPCRRSARARELREPLLITVHLAPEDPRYVDLRRNVLAKLERVMPRLTIRLATTGQSVVGSTSDEAYGEVEYSYGGRADKSRSTSPREILPLLYALAGGRFRRRARVRSTPAIHWSPSAEPALLWFFGGFRC